MGTKSKQNLYSDRDATKSGYGPSALLTPANLLTSFRVLLTPVMIVLVLSFGPSSWLLWSVWSVLAFSDGLDGTLARRHGVTRSGAFLDPLADKILVLGTLAALVVRHDISWVPVALIAIREVAMNTFRMYAGNRGITIPARPLAKLKTLLQDFAIAAAFFPPVAASYHYVFADLLWASVALTIITGLEYAKDARHLLHAANVGRLT
ncbi:MAG: CDP-alcohol phosphatidyltransferase family protein [Firmicutes bacterium]|nr:CDP-alcohol phosphatidyltransferase family protein [Bacillota bacterium]